MGGRRGIKRGRRRRKRRIRRCFAPPRVCTDGHISGGGSIDLPSSSDRDEAHPKDLGRIAEHNIVMTSMKKAASHCEAACKRCWGPLGTSANELRGPWPAEAWAPRKHDHPLSLRQQGASPLETISCYEQLAPRCDVPRQQSRLVNGLRPPLKRNRTTRTRHNGQERSKFGGLSRPSQAQCPLAAPWPQGP